MWSRLQMYRWWVNLGEAQITVNSPRRKSLVWFTSWDWRIFSPGFKGEVVLPSLFVCRIGLTLGVRYSTAAEFALNFWLENFQRTECISCWVQYGWVCVDTASPLTHVRNEHFSLHTDSTWVGQPRKKAAPLFVWAGEKLPFPGLLIC